MRSSHRIAKLAIVFSFMIVGCQQAEDPTLEVNSTKASPVLLRAANGALYSASCIKTRGLRALSTCGVTRGVKSGRAATVVDNTTSATGQYTVYSPPQYQQPQYCQTFTGTNNCYQALGYQTNQNGYGYVGNAASYAGSTNQGYSPTATSCTVCLGGSCQPGPCFATLPAYADTPYYSQSTGTYTTGATSSTSTLMGNWIATDGTGGAIQFASGSYIRTSNVAAGESGSYTSDGVNVQFSPSGAAPYTCTASYPSSTQLSLLCTQNGVATGYFYSRQY